MVAVRDVVTMPVADLVEDLSVYPRHAVDGMHVGHLLQALESGSELPPVVACAKSKRITDGWHRVRAYKRLHGPTAVVSVELRHYKTEADLIEDAVRMNSAHGRLLEGVDRVRAANMLERVGVPLKRIAVVLHITPEKVQNILVRVATAPVRTESTMPGTKTIALKRPVAHLAGQRLTEEQARAHDSAPGTSYLLIVRQLKDAVETGLINPADERLKGELTALKKLLQANGY